MQQLVRVQKCNDDHTVLVIPVQSDPCPEDCQSCTGCNNQKQKLRKVRNSINATSGQVVVLTTNSWVMLFIRACYLLPLLLLFLGLGFLGSVGGMIGFFLGLAFSFWATTKEVEAYTITSLSGRLKEKGDNDLD